MSLDATTSKMFPPISFIWTFTGVILGVEMYMYCLPIEIELLWDNGGI